MIREILLYSGFECVYDDNYNIDLVNIVNTPFITLILTLSRYDDTIYYCNSNPNEKLSICIDDNYFKIETKISLLEKIIAIRDFNKFMKDEIRQMRLDKLNI